MRGHSGVCRKAFLAAFPYTIPILTGFLFLGIAYGIYMNVSGFSPIYPILMSMAIFAGSMEFVTVDLLLGMFHPMSALILAFMVNARHLFYGISMLDKYKNVGKKRWYLIFGMCDESFSINCTTEVPAGVDRGWFYFFVTLLNQCYWVCGAAIGGICGSLISFETEGLDFVMTALLVVIFLEQWMKEKDHTSGVIGIVLTVICLVVFGNKNFIIPSMLGILGVLTLMRGRLERRIGE
ncbi:putative uncharacterized protein [Blautia hydrogenotrophica CAG:147]|uniref:AzlC family ABC transporter permease n=1 Tax=Blautia hydrogenotrophica TaxID=53443 RepID=UPI000335C79A|nr:AzlC family ABC transporter permease [Blautia hydrogenotrophica]MEE0462643.1 AzlC family ABC transporter permease [Blautia hydrogenotrophica]CCX59653.1 putative uncharacterized protein [Blautia hydrogenotrophica CAG:147]